MVLGVAVGGGYLVQRSADSARDTNAPSLDDLALLREARVSRAIADRSDASMAAADAKAKADAAAADAAAQAKKASTTSSGGGGGGGGGGVTASDLGLRAPKSCTEYTKNRLLGCQLMLERGYALEQMACLDKMWTKESGWNPKAENKSSGAYGIPQALPATKLSKYGDDWRTNPVPQIKWGLDYIKQRYKSPCGAWSFWLTHNWY